MAYGMYILIFLGIFETSMGIFYLLEGPQTPFNQCHPENKYQLAVTTDEILCARCIAFVSPSI